jgi:hypothetical protein
VKLNGSTCPDKNVPVLLRSSGVTAPSRKAPGSDDDNGTPATWQLQELAAAKPLAAADGQAPASLLFLSVALSFGAKERSKADDFRKLLDDAEELPKLEAKLLALAPLSAAALVLHENADKKDDDAKEMQKTTDEEQVDDAKKNATAAQRASLLRALVQAYLRDYFFDKAPRGDRNKLPAWLEEFGAQQKAAEGDDVTRGDLVVVAAAV